MLHNSISVFTNPISVNLILVKITGSVANTDLNRQIGTSLVSTRMCMVVHMRMGIGCRY